MDDKNNGTKNDGGLFNRHTGAAFGLIIGIVLGSLLLNLSDVAAAGGLPDKLRSAVQTVVENVAPVPAQEPAPIRAGS
jgi:hypothetical protein